MNKSDPKAKKVAKKVVKKGAKKVAKKAVKKVVKKAFPLGLRGGAGRLKTSAPDVNIGFNNNLPFPLGQIAEAVDVLRSLPKV